MEKAMVTTLGTLIKAAKARGDHIPKDEKGRPYYQLTVENGILMLNRGVLECRPTDKKNIMRVLEHVEKAKVTPTKDKDGGTYVTLVVDTAKNEAYIEPTTAEDLRKAKAISPKKRDTK